MSSKYSYAAFLDWYQAQDGTRFSFGLIKKYFAELEANAEPVANNVSYSGIAEDGGSLTFAFDATDSDGDDLVYRLASQPSEGIVKANNDGTFSFDPAGDFQDLAVGETREVSFNYQVLDGNGGSDVARATITVTGTNDLPVANDVSYGGVEEDGAAQVFAYGATDVDGDHLEYTILNQPTEGSVVDNGDGTFSFNPGTDFQDLGEGESRSVSFSFEVSDGNGGVDNATSTITISGTNDAPTAAALTAVDVEDQNTVTIDLLANAGDLDGDTLTVVHVGDAPNGTVTDNGDGTVTYIPDPDFNGDDTFSYTISDGNGGVSKGSVTVQVAAVNDAPVAVDDTAETNAGTVISIDLLSNDSDVDGDALTISSIGSAQNGSVIDNGDGTVSYAPNAGFSGIDSFTYTITDGNGGRATATAIVTVLGANTAPTANDVSYGGVEEDGLEQVFAYDSSDVDGDQLSYSVVSQPSEGSVTDNGDGTFSFDPGSDFQDLAEGETRQVSFTYQVSDGEGGTDQATATIRVTGTNDAPVAATLTALDEEDRNTVTIDLLGNAGDLDGDTLTVIYIEDAPNGTVTDNGDGTVTYVPDPDFNGTDIFSYTISDGKGGESTGTVSVFVAPLNDAPVAVDDTAQTQAGTSVLVDLLANDYDIDGDDLSIGSVGTAQNGTVTDNGDGTVSYTPNAGFSGTDNFNYMVTDGNGGEATATATVTVDAVLPTFDEPIAPPPVMTTEILVNAWGSFAGGVAPHMVVMVDGIVIGETFVSATSETQYSFMVDVIPGQGHKVQVMFDNDAALNGEDRNLFVSSIILAGQTVLSIDPMVTYDRGALDGVDVMSGRTTMAWNGTLVFDLSGEYFSSTTDGVIVNDDTAFVAEGGQVIIDLLANDWSIDGSNLTIVSIADPGNGTIMDLGDGTVLYTPDLDYFGTDTFSYTVSDELGRTKSGNADITIQEATPIGGANADPDAMGDIVVVVGVQPLVSNEILDRDFSGDWKSDWPDVAWSTGWQYTEQVGTNDGTALRVNFNQGEVGKGLKLKANFEGQERGYLEYEVTFGDGFDFVKGGKLPGLAGGTANAGGSIPDGTDGWSARFMWTTGGQGIVYLYHPDQPYTWGDNIKGSGFYFTPGQTHTLAQEIIMNTPGEHDGVLRAWLDGELVIDRSDIRYRDVPDLQVDSIRFETFFGGGTSSWAPTKDEHIDFNNFRIDGDISGDSGSANETVVVDLLANDTDPDDDDLSIIDIGAARSGTVTDNGDGTVSYTADAGFVGIDSFNYTISDGNGGTDVATATVVVDPDAVSSLSTQSQFSFRVSGDQYEGSPEMNIYVDGVQLGGTLKVTADHRAGEWQTFDFAVDLPEGAREISVQFLNDAIGSSFAEDRNLFVDYVEVNGVQVDSTEGVIVKGSGSEPGQDNLYSNGTLTWNVAGRTDLFTQIGDNTLVGGAGNDTLLSYGGNDIIAAGAGNDILDGGVGHDTLAGGAGNDTFVFGASSGNDVVLDFNALSGNGDVIDLTGLGLQGFSDLTMVETAAGDTIVNLKGNDQIKLIGVKIDDLDAQDFLF